MDASSLALARRFYRDWVHLHWRKLVLAVGLMLVVALSTGAYPLVIDQAFDLLAERDPKIVWLLPPVILAVTAVKGTALYFQVVVTQEVVRRVVAALQKRMYRTLVEADVARVLAEPTGHLVARFTTDVGLIAESATRAATNLVRDLFTVIVLLVAMLWLDWVLALVVLVVYPIAAWPIVRMSHRLRKVAGSMQRQIGGMTAFLHEGLAGIRMVKAYRLETYQQDRAGRGFDEMARLHMKSVRTKAGIDPILEVLGGLAIAGVLAVGGWRIASGESSVGEFTGFISALIMAAQPVRALGTLNVAVQEGLSGLERCFALIDEPPRLVERAGAAPLRLAPPPSRGEVRFEAVAFAYPGHAAVPALAGIDLVLPAGKTTALVGPSGAGKTTVLNLVPRFFDPTAGRILIDGQDLRDLTIDSLRDAIGLVGQDAVLFDDTIRANIAFGDPLADDRAIEEAARAAAAWAFVTALPEGLDAPVGDRGERLSGGQRQRIALARAILKDPPILLLDEATSALDAESERQVQEALDNLSRGRTTLVIAHRLSTVRNADRIVVLDAGRVVETGTHDDLMARDGLYARLCRIQFVDDAAGSTTVPDGSTGSNDAEPDTDLR
ncbi:MAG: ABC transporter ATP-binding protein [Pseudomonadota bacterium]